MDKGGFVLEAPSLFGGQVRYTTLEHEGPRFFQASEQFDTWEVPRSFKDFETTNINHPIATGEWKRKRNKVTRRFKITKTSISNNKRESLVNYFKIRKKFSKATIWKK